MNTLNRSANAQALWVGLACFASLFGAGNLIFPSYLGLQSGKNLTAFVMFIVMDIILSCLGYLAESKRPNQKMSTLARSGMVLFIFLQAYSVCLGFIGAVPRTAATSFEIGIQPLIPGVPSIVYSIIYFGLAFVFVIKPGKVVDIVGKYLTPALIVGIIIIVVKGLFDPLGPVSDTPQIEGLFKEGVLQGYQTMDAMASPSFSLVFITGIVAAGFTEAKDMTKILVRGSLIAGVLLALIYGGLFLLGAQLSTEISPADVSQTALITMIVERIMGRVGLAIFAVVVVLACLTTAIGSISGSAQIWGIITKGKFKYEYVATVYCIGGIVFSQLSVAAILNLVSPLVMIIFPAYITLIILSLFTNQIKNDNVFIFATVGAMAFAAFDSLNIPVLGALPGDTYMMGWVIPAIICGVIGYFVPSKKYRDPIHAEAAGVELTSITN